MCWRQWRGELYPKRLDMRLLQYKENEFINLDAIASVRVMLDEPKRGQENDDLMLDGEDNIHTLTLHVTLLNGTKINFFDQFAYDAYNAFFNSDTIEEKAE